MNTPVGLNAACVAALVDAAKGRDLTKVAGLWDTLAGFADSVGMAFPTDRRDAIMTAASTLSAHGKGRMSGGASTVTYRASVGAAWKAAVTHAESKGASKETLKAWQDDWARLASVAAFAKGTGSLKFEVA